MLRGKRFFGIIAVILVVTALTNTTLQAQTQSKNSIFAQENIPSRISDIDISMLEEVLNYAYGKFSDFEAAVKNYDTAKKIADLFSAVEERGRFRSGGILYEHYGLTEKDVSEFFKREHNFNYKRLVLNRNEEIRLSKKTLSDFERLVDEIVSEYENNAVLQLIPPKYRYPLALKTMHDYVANMVADSWKECAQLFDAQLDRWIQQQQGEEALILQMQTNALVASAARSARAAAIFSGLNLLR